MNDEKFKRCIIDAITLLKELARKAKQNANNPKEGFEDYNEGINNEILFNYHPSKASVICLLYRSKRVGLADINPERDLL